MPRRERRCKTSRIGVREHARVAGNGADDVMSDAGEIGGSRKRRQSNALPHASTRHVPGNSVGGTQPPASTSRRTERRRTERRRKERLGKERRRKERRGKERNRPENRRK